MSNPKINTPKMGEIHFKVMGLPHEEINKEVYISLVFPILCRDCRATGSDIVKNGHERKTKGNPQKYECKICGADFMTHTSFFFKEVTQAVFMLAFNEITNTRSSVTEVANRYNMSTTTLHEFISKVRGILVSKAEVVKRILLRENENSLKLTGLNQAIYIDETFLKVKGSTYFLVVAVNSEGTPLCWKLAPSRKSEVIESVLKDILENHGLPKMVITDGNPTYKKVLTDLRYEGIHVIHIHKKKRNRIIIRKCIFQNDSLHYVEELVGVNNDVFVNEGTKPIWFFSNEKKIINQNGRKGRLKGSKNRFKHERDSHPQDTGFNSAQVRKKPIKKRGPKNVFKNGNVMEIHVNPEENVLEVVSSPLDSTNDVDSLKKHFDSVKVLSILYPVFHEFNSHFITNNRIENLFSQFDHLFIPRGRRTSTSVTNEASTWLLLRQPFSLLSSVINYAATSFSSSIGFNNLVKLLIPTRISPI